MARATGEREELLCTVYLLAAHRGITEVVPYLTVTGPCGSSHEHNNDNVHSDFEASLKSGFNTFQ